MSDRKKYPTPYSNDPTKPLPEAKVRYPVKPIPPKDSPRKARNALMEQGIPTYRIDLFQRGIKKNRHFTFGIFMRDHGICQVCKTPVRKGWTLGHTTFDHFCTSEIINNVYSAPCDRCPIDQLSRCANRTFLVCAQCQSEAPGRKRRGVKGR